MNYYIETIGENLTIENLFEVICRLNNCYILNLKATSSIDSLESLMKLKDDYEVVNEFIEPNKNEKKIKLLTEVNKNIIDSIQSIQREIFNN